MEEKAAKGQLIVQAEPAEQAAATPNPSQAPKPKPAAPVPTEAQDIWKRTLEELAKTDPPLFGVLKPERFLGAKGDVYQLLIPMDKKEFSYARLSHQARRDRISAVLSQVAGKPLRFEPVLETDAHDQRMDALVDRNEKELAEAFGRENVQIDEGKKP